MTPSQVAAWALVVAGVVVTGLGVVGLVDGGEPQPVAVPTPLVEGRSAAPTATVPASRAASPTAPAPTPTAAATSASATPVESPTAAGVGVDAAAVDAFYASIMTGIRESDADLLFTRMHDAVLERYGTEQCRSHADAIGDERWNATVGAVTGPAPWPYERDELITVIPETWTVEVQLTVGDEDDDFTAHVARDVVDGELRWFTDCGDPVGIEP